MTRSTLYFLCLLTVVGSALLLRFVSPLGSPLEPVPRSQIDEQAPRDFVVHPWIAQGEEHQGPARIVSLAPSITEAICALGLRDRLVGRTQYCQYPPGIERVTTVGALTDTNYEKIKSLHPDVVFVTQNSYEPIKKLQAVGLHVEQIPHETLEEVYTGLARLGDLCGRPFTARALVGSIWSDVDRLRRYALAHPHAGTKVLMTLDMKVPPQSLYIVGPETFLDTMLHLAGYTNAGAPALHNGYSELPLEKLVELNPDVILDFGPLRSQLQEQEMYASWRQLPNLRAIHNHRVVSIGGPQWLSAGPRIAIELHRFVTLLDNAMEPGISASHPG